MTVGASKQLGRVLIIAGSDPSGGAGIQADIKTVTALGGYAATAITALTIQNTLGVTDVMPVPADFIAGQMQAVLADIGADCVKTGMLHSVEVIETVVSGLQAQNYDGPLVVDPVMVATSGDRLLEDRAVDCLKSLLISRASMLTPNIPEAEVLTGHSIKGLDDMRRAAEALLAMGAKAVLLKGGHLDSAVMTDLLVRETGEEYVCEAGKQDTKHTHGTGCTLASAVATFIAQGQSLEAAFRGAHAYLQAAIAGAPQLGQGCGPLRYTVTFDA